MMAKEASNCLFLSLLFFLFICSSGTLVAAAASTHNPSQIRVLVADHAVLSSLSNSGVSVDLHLNESFVEDLRSSNSSAISWLKTLLLDHVGIKSIVVARINGDFQLQRRTELVKLLSTLKSIQSLLNSFNLRRKVKVSLPFSLSTLQKMKSTMHERDLHRILNVIKKTGSSVLVEAIVDGEVIGMEDRFVQSAIEAAIVATSIPSFNNAPIVIAMKVPALPTGAQVAEFNAKVVKSLQNNIEISNQVSAMEDFAQKEKISGSSGRELLSTDIAQKTVHDVIFPPVSVPPNNPTPTIVTVPATNPVTVAPTNPGIPTTTPVTVPSANTNNPTVPITNPVTTPAPIAVPGTGAQPVNNPVTTYPPPAGGIPVTTPVTNPIPTPAPVTTNAPAIPGQSWCVARTGTSETSLQSALDYACGIGGADCSQIQEGANCYNPNTLQNHASYAFNSYYQKNPSPTSCDFGGTANIVNTNPSSGSCVYPSSASQSTTTTTPAVTPATPTTTGAGVPGSVSPPSVLNSSSPGSGTGTGTGSGSGATTVFGYETPPSVNTSTSMSAGLQPSISPVAMVISFLAGVIFIYV